MSRESDPTHFCERPSLATAWKVRTPTERSIRHMIRSRTDRYPRECLVLVPAREPTDRERGKDLHPGAEHPETPTTLCGAAIACAEDEPHHWASAHPEMWAVIRLLAEVRARLSEGLR
jgi:hypothetical protein